MIEWHIPPNLLGRRLYEHLMTEAELRGQIIGYRRFDELSQIEKDAWDVFGERYDEVLLRVLAA